jgi:hypothetical protein
MDPQGRTDTLGPIHRGLLVAVLAGAAWLAVVAPNPPAPKPADAPATEFSAERAMVHLRALAQTPRPFGSAANAAVRDYLSTQLRALGLSAETQPLPRVRNQAVPGANVMARIPGVRDTDYPARAVALVCHHDSVPMGPGASDNGVAVAAILETARALKAGPGLRNDIILLFTDGEETGLDGARAFASGCPWMKDLGLALNFDARGVTGPVFMYETGAGNGRVIRELAKAAPRPVANSLMYEVYQHMPNDSDFTVFKQARLPGLNFAFIGDPQHYHAPTDDLAHVSRRSLQHDGSYALSLARHFGNLDLTQLEATDAVYFDLFGRWLVHYPVAWASLLAVLAAVLFLGVTVLELKCGAVTVGKLVGGWLTWGAFGLIIGLGFRYGPGWVSGWSRHASTWLYQLPGWPYWWAAVGVTVAVGAMLYAVLRRRLGPLNLALGGLAWWVILALGSAHWLPGASYASLWPLLFGLVGVVAASRMTMAPWPRWTWLVITALPTMVFVMALVYGFFVALGPQAMHVPMVVLALSLAALSSRGQSSLLTQLRCAGTFAACRAQLALELEDVICQVSATDAI